MRWYNPTVKWLLRSPLHKLISGSIMLLEVRGVKTGRVIQVPVNYIRMDEDILIISRKERTWWRNLREQAKVTLFIERTPKTGLATAYEDAETVRENFLAMLQSNQTYRNALGIELDAQGQPTDPAKFDETAEPLVLVRITRIAS